MENSCYGCQERHIGCHSKCRKYKAFREKLLELNKKEAEMKKKTFSVWYYK